MSLKGGKRRGRELAVVSPAAFAWDGALLATLRHATLPWGESLAAQPLVELREAGLRDRLSLVAQFAAHAAFLQFAGIPDGELDPAAWAVVQKRGCDAQLVRVAAGRCDVAAAPPVSSVVQQFAERLGVELEILRQPWARADAIYAEVFLRVDRDAAGDQTWLRRAAAGSLCAPGADGLRELESTDGVRGYDDPECIATVERFALQKPSSRVVILRGVSPLERYSALAPLVRSCTEAPAVAAERILAATSDRHSIFVVDRVEKFDPASREVVSLLASARHGAWLIPGGDRTLAVTREFLIAPRLQARQSVRAAESAFVQSSEFAAYLREGDVPLDETPLPALSEPARSLVAALALLGVFVPLDLARGFLAEFMFLGPLGDLAVPGVVDVSEAGVRFASERVRAELTRLLPPATRPGISRAAAAHATGVEAAVLWLDAGEPEQAVRILEATDWSDAAQTVDALRRFPRSILTPRLALRHAEALLGCGRYRDARDVACGDELLLARLERRMGDYLTALRRLERLEGSFEVQLLHAEVLRLLDRETEAVALLEVCRAEGMQQKVRLDYERGLHGAEVMLPAHHYLASRLSTYRALERGDCSAAIELASEAFGRAANVIERVDASLDRLFAAFTAGQWDQARAIAVASLRDVEETQGDRAAGGILFTLAYLSADDGQWAHAAQRIARLRQYYTSTSDDLRLQELQLLSAHLAFSRGRFRDARRAAEVIFTARGHHDQIGDAAALILDEIDWIERKSHPIRAIRSSNVELQRRIERLAAVRVSPKRRAVPEANAPVAERLFAFRLALVTNDDRAAASLASELDLEFEGTAAPAEIELRFLRAAATREYPYAPHDFDVPWCFATRNRLGHWSTSGRITPDPALLERGGDSPDWAACGERELLFIEGLGSWSLEGKEAIAAMFRVRAENHRLRRVLAQEEQHVPTPIDGIVGHSPAIREVESVVARVARRDVPACILGESGTGKELIARAMHRQSPRRQKAFTAINCAALPENLIESELFGHVRGAFTGADRDRAGLIESTDGGTLFLDEVGELPLSAQAKLLRFLQEGEFRRVGDVVNRTADVRVVAATNRKLDEAVEAGRFREDLYYRIRGVEIVLPPLRERAGDVLLLARHLLAAEKTRHASGPAALSPDVEAIFGAYRWPGNVRELQNTIRGAHAMAGEARQIDVQHLPERLRNVAPSRVVAGSYQDAVTTFKRDLIERSLLHARGNQNRAATLLGMSRQALAYQIRELGIMVRK